MEYLKSLLIKFHMTEDEIVLPEVEGVTSKALNYSSPNNPSPRNENKYLQHMFHKNN